MEEWFEVSKKTVHEWLAVWRDKMFVVPASGEERVRQWKLASEWEDLVLRAARPPKLEPE